MRLALRSLALAGAASLALAGIAQAQVTDADKQQLLTSVEKGSPHMAQVAHQIWEWAEVGYQETKSSALLQSELKASGFTIQPGVAGMPTAFVASFKNGEGPVLAILAEFDALPGLAQKAHRRSSSDGMYVMFCVHSTPGEGKCERSCVSDPFVRAEPMFGRMRVT